MVFRRPFGLGEDHERPRGHDPGHEGKRLRHLPAFELPGKTVEVPSGQRPFPEGPGRGGRVLRGRLRQAGRAVLSDPA